MKKINENRDLRPEYDFSRMSGGVHGKHLESYRKGTNLVRLDADVAKAFKSDKSVNDALRAVTQAAEVIHRLRAPANFGMQLTVAASRGIAVTVPAAHPPVSARQTCPLQSLSAVCHE